MSSGILCWADRHPVSLYQSGLWPGGCTSTVPSNHPREFHQPTETNMLSKANSSCSEDSEDQTYQFHVYGPTPRHNPASPRNSLPWSPYSVAEHLIADPPPSDESLIGNLESNGIHVSVPPYSGTPMDCSWATPPRFMTSSSIDVTEEAPLGSIGGPQR